MSEFSISEDDMSWMLLARGELDELQELGERVSIALKIQEIMEKRIKEITHTHTKLDRQMSGGMCKICDEFYTLKSILDEANSYIMKETNES